MTESAADMARLMNVVEAIVAEMERQGVAGAVADLGFDPMPMAQAGDPGGRWCRRSLPGAAQSGIGRLAALADRQRGFVMR